MSEPMDASRWTEHANCRGTDPERFFVRAAADARAVLRLCRACPVRESCLEYALVEEIDHGVWGGLTERQRRTLRERRLSATA